MWNRARVCPSQFLSLSRVIMPTLPATLSAFFKLVVKRAIVFSYVVLIMVFRPQGLLGEESREAG